VVWPVVLHVHSELPLQTSHVPLCPLVSQGGSSSSVGVGGGGGAFFGGGGGGDRRWHIDRPCASPCIGKHSSQQPRRHLLPMTTPAPSERPLMSDLRFGLQYVLSP
jgi:hypothetical protein